MINTQRVPELNQTENVQDGDLLVVQTADGVKKVTSKDLLKSKADNLHYDPDSQKLQLSSNGNVIKEVDISSISADQRKYTDQKISDLVGGASESLDTLKEIEDELSANKNVADALNSAIGNKVDKIEGKGLSTNDYTTDEKDKLANIASGAEVNVQSDWNEPDTSSDTYIQNKPTSLPASDVYDWAKAETKPVYTKDEVGLDKVDNTPDAKKSVLYSVASHGSDMAFGIADEPNYEGVTQDNIADVLNNLTPSSKGSATQPVYLKDGFFEPISHTVEADVPADAKFTDTVYTHPSSTAGAKASGLYKITTDANGHVTGATAVAKEDITALGIPAQDTTYSDAVGSDFESVRKSGLMSKQDKFKLDSIKSAGTYYRPVYINTSMIDNGGNSSYPSVYDITALALFSTTPTQLSIDGGCVAAGQIVSDTKLKLSRGVAICDTYLTGKDNYSYECLYGFMHGQGICKDSVVLCSGRADNHSVAMMEGEAYTGTFGNSLAILGITKHSYSQAIGYNTQTSGDYQMIVGRFNAECPYISGDMTHFAVGVGYGNNHPGEYQSTSATGFRVSNSKICGKFAYSTTGADYAEYFEWLDGNPDGEDRRGYFVTLEGDKIRKANSEDDYILGVVSGNPAIIGNSDADGWNNKFLTDSFGSFVRNVEEYEHTGIVVDSGISVNVAKTAQNYTFKINPNYDPNKEYTQRSDRPEWDAIGMLGQLSIRDNGECQINGYCKVNNEGIAIPADKSDNLKYRVIKRLEPNIIKIIFR